MSHTTTEIKAELKKDIEQGLGRMRMLRDEVRVRLHLAGMEAKDEWNKLEPTLLKVEDAATDFSETTRHAVKEAVARLTKLKNALS